LLSNIRKFENDEIEWDEETGWFKDSDEDKELFDDYEYDY